jgi:hypothetical protein
MRPSSSRATTAAVRLGLDLTLSLFPRSRRYVVARLQRTSVTTSATLAASMERGCATAGCQTASRARVVREDRTRARIHRGLSEMRTSAMGRKRTFWPLPRSADLLPCSCRASPCSAGKCSLFRRQGITHFRARKAASPGPCDASRRRIADEIPCKFPPNREDRGGDRFARDCTAHHFSVASALRGGRLCGRFGLPFGEGGLCVVFGPGARLP